MGRSWPFGSHGHISVRQNSQTDEFQSPWGGLQDRRHDSGLGSFVHDEPRHNHDARLSIDCLSTHLMTRMGCQQQWTSNPDILQHSLTQDWSLRVIETYKCTWDSKNQETKTLQKSWNAEIQNSENPRNLKPKNTEILESWNPKIQKSQNPGILESVNPKILESKNFGKQRSCNSKS